MPIVGFMGDRHPLDFEHTKFLADRAEEILIEAGASTVWKRYGGRGPSPGGQHQAGTCRMGDDPAKSVVNRYGQVHDIENLYVADGGHFVTGAGFNPALTIMAMGYWVSHHILKGTKV